jgi:hypothetical protein
MLLTSAKTLQLILESKMAVLRHARVMVNFFSYIEYKYYMELFMGRFERIKTQWQALYYI